MSNLLAVLGGCGGIGRTVVQEARARGYDVAVLDLPASLAAHPPPDDTLSIALDATEDQQVAEAATALREQAPTLKGFVNACGFLSQRVPTLEIAPENWAESIEGNLTSAFYSARHFAPLIAPGGAMVVIGSGLGASPRPDYGAYAVAKAGIAALIRQLALELAPDIRVNCVAPSAVDTAFLTGGTGRSRSSDTPVLDRDAVAASIPLKRLATPEDIADPILFLLSDHARYITGQTLYVNGGAYMP